jgi:hypothetical protein
MTDHAELLKGARKLADTLGLMGDYPKNIAMLRTLADTVEQQDALLESGRTNRHADALTIRALATLVEKQRTIIAETTAACVTCDEAITNLLTSLEDVVIERGSPRGRELHGRELHTARHLARRAVKLAEPKRDVEETLAEATTKYDALLRRLGDTTNQPPEVPVLSPTEQVEYDQFLPIIAKLGAEAEKPPAPLVEVAMRVTHPTQHEWGWECFLGGRWITQPERYGAFWATESAMMEDAYTWLAALSKQLGVPLVAVWKDGE